MGISGLLPALKAIQYPTTLERYRGKTLAVDTYAWLHKAAFSCSMQLVLGEPTTAYIDYIVRRINMFAHFGITPYLVFDGDYLPSKSGTEKERREKRDEYRLKALDALKNDDRRTAMNFCQKACDITPEMAKSLIEELKKREVRYVVAPYEADSQLVYLEKAGLVDGVVSEDSDLLIFGCQTLITKLNDRGECIEIKRTRFSHCTATALSCLTQQELQLTAIISGCDYTKGVPGLGVQKAASLVKRFKNFNRIAMSLRFEGKISVPEAFEEEYKRARIAFRHQVVFDPVKREPAHLNPLPEDNEDSMEYILSCTGQILDTEIHRGVAAGNLNPFTKTTLLSREQKLGTAGKSSSYGQHNTLDSYARRTRSLPSKGTSEPKAHRSPYASRKTAIYTIDRFISRMAKSSTPLSKKRTVDSSLERSPLAKRRRILDGVSDEVDNSTVINHSKFFQPKAEAAAEFVDIDSSEFVVSDPEEEETDITPGNTRPSHYLDSDISEPQLDTQNILGNMDICKEEKAPEQKIIKSFGYASSRPPLRDITNLKKPVGKKKAQSSGSCRSTGATRSASMITVFGYHENP
ncbi:DEKNAAC101177 [Brettanomyces naardenensis]|uniref:DEKNAAC101177 n=1 Tax=Brettanomyces naardenensis TaxID=13370 RepID=A0A448YHE8_BRENA|nr:DEKNAAC101177 [Brettanomyces naardenensis]